MLANSQPSPPENSPGAQQAEEDDMAHPPARKRVLTFEKLQSQQEVSERVENLPRANQDVANALEQILEDSVEITLKKHLDETSPPTSIRALRVAREMVQHRSNDDS